MKVDEKGNTITLKDTQGDFTAFLMKITHHHKTFEKHNLIINLLPHKDITIDDVRQFEAVENYIQTNDLDTEVIEQTEIQVKYAGYIAKEKNNADKLNRLENLKIPNGFDYMKLKSMSIEARQKLTKIQPVTISQASRISGVSPNDISVLLVYLGR